MVAIIGGIRVGPDMFWIEYCIDSLLSFCDKVVLLYDPKTKDKSLEIITNRQKNDEDRIKIIVREYGGSSSKLLLMNEMIKEGGLGCWCCFLDADEVLADNCFKFRDIITNADKDGKRVLRIKGHHFIYNLAWEDSTFEKHYWDNRFFKNTGDLYFEKNKVHEILYRRSGPYRPEEILIVDEVPVFHYGYIKGITKIIEKNCIDFIHRQIHTVEFLHWWRLAHLTGTYPVKLFDVNKHPDKIKRIFCIGEYSNNVPDWNEVHKRTEREL